MEKILNYIRQLFEPIKSSLESLAKTLNSIKNTLSIITDILKTIFELLGFIGLKVSILLIVTYYLISILNLVSPKTKKTNYLLSVCLVVWLAVIKNMQFQIVIAKYLLIMISPLIFSYILNNIVFIYETLFCNIKKKFIFYKNKLNLNFLSKMMIKDDSKIALIFTTSLPTYEEIKTLNNNKNIIIYEKEKIFLTDDKGEIILNDNIKTEQFISSANDKNVDLLWCWDDDYRSNRTISLLNNINKIRQTKYIIGGGHNSYLLNFLQSKWNWQVIYGKNFKYINNTNLIIENINKKNIYELILINNIELANSIKTKLVGGDLFSLTMELFNENCINIKNKILFLDVNCETNKEFYKLINQLTEYILRQNRKPKMILFGNITINDNINYSHIIQNFSNDLQIPFLKINNYDLIKLNTIVNIEYVNQKIQLIV